MKVPEQAPVELARPELDDVSDRSAPAVNSAEHLLSNLPEGRQSAWGRPVETESKDLERLTRQLQADLQLLVSDLKRGPLARLLENAHDYLGELRREFLRHHRRLVIQVRTPEGCADLSERVHFELAELAERFRSVALGRSSRLANAWNPQELVELVDRTVDALPDHLTVPLEPVSYEGADMVAVIRRVRRRLRRRRPLTRTIRMRELVHHHVAHVTSERIEGLTTPFVRIDIELSVRTRTIFEAIAEGFEALIGREAAELPDLVQLLRTKVEDEIVLAEKEAHRLASDVTRRAVAMFGEAMTLIKADLPEIGTFDLPGRRRSGRKWLRQRERVMEALAVDLSRVRDSGAGDYALLALQLEFIAFEARAHYAMEGELADLEADVRGRSHVQLERVQAALRGALEKIAQQPHDEEELHDLMEPVERVLGEALRVLFQLNDQLEADHAASPLLDALTRQAQTLTDRYRVPTARLAHSEWELPAPSTTIEVPLRELVSAYMLTDVGPRVLEATNGAARDVQPLLAFCQELERIVTFNTEAGAGEGMAIDPLDSSGQLQEFVVGALNRRMDVLSEQIERTDQWATELSSRVQTVVVQRLTDLRHHLAEGRASSLRLDLVRMAQSRRRLRGELDRVTTVLDRLRGQTTGSIRRTVGEERLRRWKALLGLGEEDLGPPEAGQFAPPEAQVEIPIVYRRLFAAQAHWAGDVLHQDAVKLAREHLAHAPGLRAVAVVGLDAARKVAMVSAISRGERFGAVRRVAWKKPATLDEVERVLADLPRGHLIVVTGLRWLISARPGGFDPLRRFVEGVVADANQNAWLLESGHFVWEYACRISAIGSLVTTIVRADPLPPLDLENAVLARHHLSGHELVFVDSARNTFKAGPVRSAIQDQYFLDLHEASGGLLHAALVFWIGSIVEVNESAGRVRVGAVPRSSIPRLRALPEHDLLMLYQVARQGWMDGETLAFLFRTDVTTARAALVRLANLGLLERAHRVYQVPSHLRGGVVQALAARGWV